ncbi:oxidoreductase [Nocardia sp. CC201C]|uniref:oxidoreductase n=1 Tax=Nocardia sp. CC201C TaxID=3044575 RepID=UPI0024A90ACF|nr:oxidoreductase [Nocardia sp. CC201C]
MGTTQQPQWTAADIPDLHGRVAVVTGASAGIGVATAFLLADSGAHVVLACRNLEKAELVADSIRVGAPDAELSLVELDLAAQASVHAAARQLRDRFTHIDLLINNAGTAVMRPERTVDDFETTIATNHLGHFALTGLLLDRLLAAPDARVVSVTSGAFGKTMDTVDVDDLFFERRDYRGLHAYAQSKLAVQLFIAELQRRLNGTDARLVATMANPGIAQSDFEQNLGPVVRFLSRPAFKWFFDSLKQTPEMGALPTVRAAVDPSVRGGEFFGPTGRFKGYPVRKAPTPGADDPELAARLWEKSEQLTGVSFRFTEPVGDLEAGHSLR